MFLFKEARKLESKNFNMLEIKKDVKLSEYSTFKIGGEAKEFVEVKSESDLNEALEYSRKNKLKFFILGGGSNVIFDDDGYEGLVIRMVSSVSGVEISDLEGGVFKVWAGENLSSILTFSKENNLSGLEWAAGIPGTLGGAVRGNCGAFDGDMSQVVLNVDVLDEKNNFKTETFSNDKCKFSYRESLFKNNLNLIIVSIEIKLKEGKKEEIENKMREIIEKRKIKQPKLQTGSVGSFFMNPVVENEELRKRFEKDTGSRCIEKRIPAGWLIEEAGFKGKKIGGIMVSDTNANFILNTGGATAKEAVIAASIIKQKIRNEFGIQLKEEVKFVFNN